MYVVIILERVAYHVFFNTLFLHLGSNVQLPGSSSMVRNGGKVGSPKVCCYFHFRL